MSAERYRRLPGTARHALGHHQLWLGRGHLLLVNNTSYRESYQRVELADVQAFVICQTSRNPLRVVLAALLMVLLSPVPFSPEWLQVLLLCLAGLVLAVLVVELVRGAGCRAFVRTPVQLLRLPSLKRWRTANRIADRLRPLIDEVQGAIPAEELQARWNEVPPLPPEPSTRWVHEIEASRRQRAPYGGVLHTILGVLLAVLVVLWTGHVMTSSAWLLGLGSACLVASASLAVAAGFRQRDGSLPRELRLWTWWVFGWLCTVASVVAVMTATAFYGHVDAEAATGLSVAALVVTAGFFGLWVAFELRRRRTRS